MSAHDLWFSQSWGNRLARGLLTPASWLYAGGWQTYLWLYQSGVKKSSEPHRPVLCVGNLTVGGSGKSPLTLHLYDLLTQHGTNVVVGCSGYGSPAAEGARIAPEGPLHASEWGDEPAMLRWFRPEMSLVVGRRRVLAAQLVHREFPDSVLLMDDGFQHLPLKKHFTFLIDEPNPANPRCLPAGPYREPRRNRDRADLIIPSKFKIKWEFLGPFDPETRSKPGTNEKSVHALTAIARPERFLDCLKEQGFNVERKILLSDHDPLTAGTLLESIGPKMPLVVTAKDWIKLKDRPDIGGYSVWVAWTEARIEPADMFREFLHGTITQLS